jgi:hypothetical protein
MSDRIGCNRLNLGLGERSHVSPTSRYSSCAHQELCIRFPHITLVIDSQALLTVFQSVMRDLVDGPAKTVWVRLGLPPDDIENMWLTEVPDPSVPQ